MEGKLSWNNSTITTNSESRRNDKINPMNDFNSLNGMRIIIVIGIVTTLTFLVLAILYFRPIILATIIPIAVISATIYGIFQRKHHLLWLIIGVSWFHVFLTLYFEFIFMYFFFHKPNYIIMVLNWAFDRWMK